MIKKLKGALVVCQMESCSLLYKKVQKYYIIVNIGIYIE